MHIAIFAHYVL